ncbi:hypothetical protein [Streptomyces griseus]|uniref:hypothetical protein n=1 Tax=Streptomyces griseus TaxID=1911 RepID=UPI0013BA24E4|nr:hypothetical protein [Streptomyces griseus]
MAFAPAGAAPATGVPDLSLTGVGAVGAALGAAASHGVVVGHASPPGTAAPHTLVPGRRTVFGVVGHVAAVGVAIAPALLGERSSPVAEHGRGGTLDRIVADRDPPDPLRSFHARP